MREIKFRGKSDLFGWVYGSYAIIDGSCHIFEEKDLTEDGHHICQYSDRPTWVNPSTIGQYTGLKDANGKEIYEGDIVANTSGEFIYEVVYDDKRFASFCLCRKQDMFRHYFGEAMEAEECKVIGNIHNNPELIEK